MSNTIKIKRGSGTPSGSDLAVYELGYETGTTTLHINDNGTYRQIGGTTYSGGTNLTLSGTTFNVDDAFLKNNADDTTSGTVTGAGFNATNYFQINKTGSTGSFLKIVNSGWSNATTHDILYNSWLSNIGDYTYLKSAGNSTTGHGIAMVGDSVFAVGDTDVETGGITNSATAPFTDTWFYVNGSGNGWFKGNVTTSAHLVLPYGEINDSGTDLNIVGTNAITLQSESGTALTVPNASTNVILEGELFLKDGKDLVLGNDSDLELKFDGSHSYFKNTTGDLYIQQHADNKDIVFQCDDNSGNVTAYLTLDGSAGYTTVQKTLRLDDNVQLHLGTGNDLKIYHNSSSGNNNIENHSGSLYITNEVTDGDIFLRVDDGGNNVITAIQIDASNAGSVFMPNDNATLGIGAGNDLRLFHDGTNSYIYNYQGELRIGNTVDDADTVLYGDDGSGGNTPYITLDGSTTNLLLSPPGNVGIGETSVDANLHITGSPVVLKLERPGQRAIRMGTPDNSAQFIIADSDDLKSNQRYIIDSSGNHSIYGNTSFSSPMSVEYGAVFNEGGHNSDFRVESDNQTNCLLVDASQDRVETYALTDDATRFGYTSGSSLVSSVNTEQEYADLPIGYSRMMHANLGTDEGMPLDSQHFYFNKLNIRDSGGGWNALAQGYNNNEQFYIGHSLTNSAFATWSRVVVENSSGISTSPVKKITSGDDFALGELTNNLRMKGNGTDSFNFLTSGNGWATLNANTYNSGSGFFQSDDYSTDVSLRRGPNNDDRITIQASHTDIVGDANTRARFGSTVTIYKPTHINHQLYGGFGAQTTGGTTDWNDSTNARSGGGHTLLLEDATNGPTDSCVNSSNTTYMHPFSFEYASWNNDGNMTQFGIPYYFANNDGVRPAVRSRYSGTWSAWHSLITGNAAGQIQGSAGTESLPSYSFNGNGVSDLDTGMYRRSANQIGFTCAGEDQFYVSDGTIHIEQPVKFQFANDQRIFDNGSGGLKIGAASHELQFYAGGSDPMQFYTGGISGTERIRLESGGDCHFDQDVIAFSTTPSDKRLKTNIKEINYGLETVMKLNPKEYDWKKDDRHDIGFIAQEVEEVIPEIVKDKKHFDKEIKTLDYEKLTAVLIKAVQEQQQQINELKEKLNG